MAKISLIQTNMTGGELSPEIALARVDIAKYQNGLRTAENVQIRIQGGAKRRPGTRFIIAAGNAGFAVRLIDFVYNRDQAYIVEMGHGYMRFFRSQALYTSITSPYGGTQVRAVGYVQKADTAFFVHEAIAPQRLQRFGDASWVLAAPPYVQQPVEEQGHYPATSLTLSATVPGAATATAGASAFLASDVGRSIVAGAGLATVTGYTSDTVVSINIVQPFASSSAASGAWSLSGSPRAAITPSAVGPVGSSITLTGTAVWRADDVGSIVSINGGSVRIESVVDPDNATAVVLTALSAATSSEADSWSLESPAWGARGGYPRAVTINKQRLMFAGSPMYPQTVWGSGMQAYLDFSFGVNDDAAFRFELDGPRNSPIRHLAPTRQLLVLTDSDEMSLKGGQEKPITPTNIQKTDESTAGSNYVRPVKVGAEMLSVDASGRKINAVAYRYEIDGFAAADRTVFANHITGSGVIELSFKKDPDKTLMAVRADGVLAVCAYDIDQEVTGWARWTTQGQFESCATVPTATGEETYCVVQRTVGGSPVKYVEVFDPDVLLDCAIARPAVDLVNGDTVWAGLGHLEGKTVQALADGAYLGEYVVAGGQVTLSRPAKYAQIGLGFTSQIEPLQVELAGGGGTIQGSQITCTEVVVRVLDTNALQINGQELDFRSFDLSGTLDMPPPAVSGDVRSMTLTDELYRTRLVISQSLPQPMHVLDIIRKVSVNG
jgi:hypothetical protein